MSEWLDVLAKAALAIVVGLLVVMVLADVVRLTGGAP